MSDTYLLLKSIPARHERLLYVTLAGLANRHAPRLYLLGDEETDGHWVEWYGNYGLEPEQADLATALERFGPDVGGAYVLGRQDADWEIPLAVTLAGLHDRVLVTGDQVRTVQAAGLTVDPLPVPQFATRLEAMVWAVAHLRPGTAPELLHANYWPRESDNIDIVDWIVARRGFSFRLTTNPVTRCGERELLGELYARSPLYAHVLGWHQRDDGECAHVHFASTYGMVPFCMTRNLNFSFHQHVPAKGTFKQKVACNPPALQSDRCYLTFVFSDGDAPHSMVDLQKRQWTRPQRGEFPFGWAIPPQMLTFGPAMLEYFYRTLTDQDELLCGPSGLGYNYLSRWACARGDVADARASRIEYVRRSDELMSSLDLRAMWPINRVLDWLPGGRIARRLAGRDVWVINADNEPGTYGVDFMDDGLIRDYCTHMPTSRGFFQGWHNIPHEQHRVIEDRPYFPCKVLAAKPDQTLRDIDRRCAVEGVPCFVPVHVNCYAMGLEGVAETIRRLDDDRYTVLLPGEFLQLAAQADRDQTAS
ncbi:MAG: GxGYxYP domain-containing protein [Planctomycetota bacterium]